MADTFNGVRHRTVRFGKIVNQLRAVDFYKAYQCRARLGDDNFGVFFFYLLNIALGRQFRTESHVKDRFYADGFEPAVQM